MIISGIRPSAEFYACSTTKNQETESRQITKPVQPDTAYKRKVLDGELANLDVERAINTMKKDQVIHQYQFFVGEELSL